MDIFKKFRMQRSTSEDLPKKEEVGEYQEILQEKDVQIKTNLEKIQTLEAEVEELKQEIQILVTKLQAIDENDFQQIMADYDELFKRVLAERQEVGTKYAMIDTYIENLECSCKKLNAKFENAKEIIYGLKNNEEEMKTEFEKKVEEYNKTVEGWDQKCKDLKQHTEETLAQANLEINTKEKEHLEEMAKLKFEILQEEAKIQEMEKMLKNKLKPSLKAPLKNKKK